MLKEILSIGLIAVCISSHASNLRGHRSYWQCEASDSSAQVWSYSNSYKRKAINEAFSLCKKNSKNPGSCATSYEGCNMIVKGRQLQSSWQCSALDHTGNSYSGDVFSTRIDAIDGAKAICKQQSVSPSSCYVRLITCKNKI